MKTAAVMTRDVVVVAPTVGAASASRMMDRLRVRHLPVVEARQLVGILSDRDLLRAGGTDSSLTCGEVMTAAPITCPPDASVGQLAALMVQHKIDSIPIVGSSGVLIGLCTSTDLLSLLIERAQAQVLPLPFDYRLRVAASDGDARAFAA
jgi:CBS domain-containing protein